MAGKKVGDFPPPARGSSIAVCRMNLSVARSLFDGGNFAESPSLADRRPLLPVF